jgi:hypothetical protein
MLNVRNALILGSALSLGACAADEDDDTGAGTADTEATASASASATDSATASATDSATSTVSATDTDSASSGADTTGGTEACFGVGGPNADGDACTANSDCASGVCTIFTDVPLNADAVCDPTPSMTDAGCNTRITGTVFDFSTLLPSEGATMKVAAALNAITDPAGADALAEATSGADGRLDITTEVPISAAIAIIALVEAPGAYLTATGLASPAEGSAYAVANGIHDLWLVPSASLDAWSTALGTDADVPAELLPLGDAGGIVGLVRDAAGLPIAGAVVEAAPGSAAIVRYVAADNTIVADATTDTGVFVILGGAQTGEDYTASVGGSVVAEGRAGTSNNVVFTMILNAE